MSLCEFHILAPVLFMIQYNMQTICDLSFSGTQFSTKDNDNDRRKFSCSQTYKGAWWYNACHSSNLNGLYLNGSHSSYANGVEWQSFRGDYYSLRRTEMKVKTKF